MLKSYTKEIFVIVLKIHSNFPILHQSSQLEKQQLTYELQTVISGLFPNFFDHILSSTLQYFTDV